MPAAFRRLLDPGDWLAVKPQLDPKASALQIQHVPGSAEYKLRIVVGLIVLAVFSTAIYFFRDDVFTVVIFSGFGLFGLLNLVYGILQSAYSMSLLITGSEVVFDSKTLFGGRHWRERLDRYRGVMLRERQLQDNDVDSFRTGRRFHVIELEHVDPAKTIALYVKEDGPPPREIQEAFARRFNLPALSPDSSGEIARPAGGLDRSLSDLRTPVPDPGSPRPGVKVSRQGETTRLTVELTRAGQGFVWLFWLLLPVGFGALVYQFDPWMGYLAAGMAAVLVLALLGIEKLMSRRRREPQRAILIDRERVWIEQPNLREDPTMKFMMRTVSRISRIPLPEVSAPLSSLPRSAVEQVRVDQYTCHDSDGTSIHPRLLIESDRGSLEYIGAQLDRKKLEWIRDYLRFRLSSRS